MARIGAEELDKLKREVDLVALVRSRVDLKGDGDDLVGLCPFHVEETPSFHVSVSKNLFHCFGCGAAGSVIDWAMKSAKVSFRHAVELLREKAPLPTHKSARSLPSPLTVDGDDQLVMNEVAAFYAARLKATPAVLAYLQRRGLSHPDLLDTFQLGFADRALQLHLQSGNRVEGNKQRSQLQKLGVFRKTGHGHLNGSLVIPIHDENRNVMGMYGRKVLDTLRAGTPKHLYLPGAHRGIFNVPALEVSREIILCEALIDALTFWCAGIRHVTSSYGVAGFTDELFEKMKRHGVERVLIAYDRDDAGEQAAQKLAPRLMEAGMDVFRIHFPQGMDANEYALKETPAAESLGILVRAALWMGKGARKVVAPAETQEPGAAPVTLEAEVEVAPPPAAVPPMSNDETPATKQEEGGKEQPTEIPVATEKEVEPAPASPVAAVPITAETFFETRGEDLVKEIGDRRYVVRGLFKNTSLDVMLVVLKAFRGPERFHVNRFDLNDEKPRENFVKGMMRELGIKEEVARKDLGSLYGALDALLDAKVQGLLKPKAPVVAISEEERQEAMTLLEDPELMQRLGKDITTAGVVGEETNKLVAYIACTSRRMEKPLAVMVRSSSGAGKSSLMDAVLSLMPEEELVRLSAVTDQVLYYYGEKQLSHKILALAEEEGSEKATYPLKVLQSEGKLAIASTGKDQATGRLVAHEYHVEGPVMVFLTTTSPETNEEFRNRCLELAADESREQTRAIHDLQRRSSTLEGLLGRSEKVVVTRVHKNAQRLLKPLAVRNPFSMHLRFPDVQTRLRRDHPKYQTLIQTIALLHQHQRPVKEAVDRFGEVLQYIDVTLDDVAWANRLAADVFGRSLDELPWQSRRLLMLIDEMVTAICAEKEISRTEVRFTRRHVREFTGWSEAHVRIQMHELMNFEYLVAYHGSRGSQFVYELVYDGAGKDGSRFVMGLTDVEELRQQYDGNFVRIQGHLAQASSAVRSGSVGTSQSPDSVISPRPNGARPLLKNGHGENGTSGPENG
jgi:DNA primase catalytic core